MKISDERYKTIGILTFWTTTSNYGQVLQAYALCRVLSKRGHHPYLIRYLPCNATGIKLILKKIINRFIQCGKSWQWWNRNSREYKFNSFRKQYFSFSRKLYHSYSELQNDPPRADIYICGSDQIWNINAFSRNNCPWFLDFGLKSTKRIAFAASFGKEQLSAESIRFIKPLMASLDKISVREMNAVELCRECGRNDAVHVLDPTLLLSGADYQQLLVNVKQPFAGKFFLGYFLNIENRDEVHYESLTQLSLHQGAALKIIAGDHAKTLFPAGICLHPGIEEWLKLFTQAEGIFTSSFHGAVFAIQLKRPFLVFPLRGRYSPMNCRVESLLSDLGLSDRICASTATAETIHEQLNRNIDWACVEGRLAELQRKTFAFLEECGC